MIAEEEFDAKNLKSFLIWLGKVQKQNDCLNPQHGLSPVPTRYDHPYHNLSFSVSYLCELEAN